VGSTIQIGRASTTTHTGWAGLMTTKVGRARPFTRVRRADDSDVWAGPDDPNVLKYLNGVGRARRPIWPLSACPTDKLNWPDDLN